MKRTLLLIALIAPAMAHADMVWSSVDPAGRTSAGGHGAHGRPQGTTLDLLYGDGATTQLWLPTLEQRPLALANGSAKLKGSGMDNYHLLYALRETETVHETALRYQYLRGKPSGRSPAELVYADKAPLEIVPAPLPREHNRYESESRAVFIVKFQGAPLPNQTVTLETTNGTRTQITSDGRGRINVVLPHDFQRIGRGRDNNPPAEFFLHTRHQDTGRLYMTSLSAEYHVNPRHWESQSGALWSGLAGFASGIGLLGFVARRRAAKG